RPVAAALDLVGDAGERDERSELAASSRELERRDVVLDTVVVAREGGRAEQVHGAVGADEPGARRGRLRHRHEGRDDRGETDEERSHTVLLSRDRRGCRYDAERTRRFPFVRRRGEELAVLFHQWKRR